MKSIIPALVTLLMLPLMSSAALADACSSGARAMISGDPKATLLSVKSVQGSNGKVTCEARIKISSGGKPPRIIVKKFKP